MGRSALGKMNELRFNDMGMDESPPTIAYVLLALAAATFDAEIVIEDDLDEEVIVFRDTTSGFEYIRVRVSSMMGTLLASVLHATTQEISALIREDAPWTLKRS